MRYIFLLFIALIGAACINNPIKKDLDKLRSRPIVFPENMCITMSGRDTTIDNFFQSDLKMVVYVDSVECASCAINHMSLWEPFIQYADSLEKITLKFYFIFTPRREDRAAVRATLSVYPINYPVLIDDAGEFQSLNPQIPDNKDMHAFLLNKTGDVILVGNPVFNPQIKNLIIKAIEEY